MAHVLQVCKLTQILNLSYSAYARAPGPTAREAPGLRPGGPGPAVRETPGLRPGGPGPAARGPGPSVRDSLGSLPLHCALSSRGIFDCVITLTRALPGLRPGRPRACGPGIGRRTLLRRSTAQLA